MKFIKYRLSRRRQRKRAEQYQKSVEQDYINYVSAERQIIINKENNLPATER